MLARNSCKLNKYNNFVTIFFKLKYEFMFKLREPNNVMYDNGFAFNTNKKYFK